MNQADNEWRIDIKKTLIKQLDDKKVPIIIGAYGASIYLLGKYQGYKNGSADGYRQCVLDIFE